MRVVFMGTPEFAVPSLEALAANFDVRLAVSQPDKPRGRGQKVSAPPVKARALELGIPVAQPLKVRDPEFLEQLKALDPDIILVAAYARLIPPSILDLPRLGCVNLHPSLLPRYRGAIPVQAPIMNGDPVTGITTFRMDEGYDTGDLLMQVETPLGPDETGEEALRRLAVEGAEVLVQTVHGLADGTLVRRPQPAEGDYTKPLKKEDLVVDWSQPAVRVRNFIRALAHEPGATATWAGEPMKLGRADVVEGVSGEPGVIVAIEKGKGPVVATGQGGVLLREVKPSGKGWMDGAAFVNGRRIEPGARFDVAASVR